MKFLDKIIEYGLYLFVFLLPWQTRWIYQEATVNGGAWEYGRFSLYGTEILLILLLILMLARQLIIKSTKSQIPNPKQILNSKIPISKTLLAAIVLFIVWSGLSIVWSSNKGLAWYGWLRLVEGLGLFWLILNDWRIVYESPTAGSRINAQACREFADDSRMVHGFNIQNIINVLILSGVVQAIFGISQFMRQVLIPANKWLGLAVIDPWQAGTSVIEFLDQRWLRAYGALSHSNILGGFLAICLLIIIINLWRSDAFSQGKRFTCLNLFYWLSAIIIFFGLLATFSRGAWLAFFIPFIGSFIYGLIRKAKNIIKINAIIIACFVGVIGLFLAVFPYQLITTRFHQDTRLEKMSIDQRIASLRQAQFIFKNNPIIGVGLNNYTLALQKNEPNQPAWYYQPAHNVYLLILSELGVIGLGSLFMILISLAIIIIKQRSRFGLLFLPLLIIGLFDHYLWSLNFGVMLWWLVIAMLFNQSIINNHANRQ